MAYSSFPDALRDRDFATSVRFGGYNVATHTTTNPLHNLKDTMDKVIAEEDVWYYKDDIIDDLTAAAVMSPDIEQAEIRLYSDRLDSTCSLRVSYTLRTHTETFVRAILRTGLHNCGFRSSPPEVW